MRIVAEFSWKFHVAAPVVLSRVPLGATDESVLPNVLVTHTERPALEIGSGVPKWQPTSVQSMPAGVEPALVGPMLQTAPTQPDSVKRLVAPGGVALSGTCEMPPPSDRLPQRRFLIGTVPARSRKVLPQEPLPGVDRKSKPVPPPRVVEVVLCWVVLLVLVDDELDDVVGTVLDVGVDDVEVDDVLGTIVLAGAELEELDELVVVVVLVTVLLLVDEAGTLVEVVVGGVMVELLVVLTVQWQVSEHPDPGGQKAPPADPGGSHSSPASIRPLSQMGCDVVVVEELVDVVGAAVLVELELVVAGAIDELVVVLIVH